MMNLMERVIIRKRHLVLDRDDVLRALDVLGQNRIFNEISIGNCGWKDASKWFLTFNANGKKWESIRNSLNIIRIWSVASIPEKSNGAIYSMD